jgi:ArsR family transcriptional regulator, lead/cadmium/zinc/bismuth-responsive transcriptional repressor
MTSSNAINHDKNHLTEISNSCYSVKNKRLSRGSHILPMLKNPSTTAILNEHLAAHVAELFRAFSDTSRVRILSALVGKEMNVDGLAEAVGISESAISHHLRGLRQMNIVQSRRDGKEVYYRIDDEHIIALFQQGVDHVQNS